jgi:hypothetical protein
MMPMVGPRQKELDPLEGMAVLVEPSCQEIRGAAVDLC